MESDAQNVGDTFHSLKGFFITSFSRGVDRERGRVPLSLTRRGDSALSVLLEVEEVEGEKEGRVASVGVGVRGRGGVEDRPFRFGADCVSGLVNETPYDGVGAFDCNTSDLESLLLGRMGCDFVRESPLDCSSLGGLVEGLRRALSSIGSSGSWSRVLRH